MSGAGRKRTRATDRGAATLELAVVAPALLALLGLVIVGGRVAAAGSAVEQASAAGARAASIARDARGAQAEANRISRASLRDQGIDCQPFTSVVDTSGFAAAVGRPANVSVRISCGVPVGDLAVPGLAGTRTISASTTSPLDRFRERR